MMLKCLPLTTKKKTTLQEKMKFVHRRMIIISGLSMVLTACSGLFYPKANAIEKIRQGMSPQQVTQLLGKPDYRRFDHGLEEWEFRKLQNVLDGEPTIIIIRFEHGKVVYMDSFKTSERTFNPQSPKP